MSSSALFSLYPTRLSLLAVVFRLLVVVRGSVLGLGVFRLSMAFVMVINLDNLSMPFSVPTSLSKCGILPVPNSGRWCRYFGQSLSICCLVWIVRPHPHMGFSDLTNLE